MIVTVLKSVRRGQAVVLNASNGSDFKSYEQLMIEQRGGRWVKSHGGYVVTLSVASRILRDIFVHHLNNQ